MAAPSQATGRSHASWTGTLALARVRVRTHRWALIGWPLVIAGLAASTVWGVREVYDTAQARAAYQATVGASTVSIAINGRGYDLTTIGGISAYEMGFYTLLVLPIIALSLTIRMTRGEEETGRDELVTALRIGRRAPLAAGALVVGVALTLGGVLSLAGMWSAGLDGAGTALFCLGLTLMLFMWAGVGLVAAQLSRTGRGAHGLGLTALGALYVARALVDGQGASATWANPTGWLAEIRPFGDDRRAWPLLASGALAVALVMLASWLRARRDLGGGILTERAGPAHADQWLRRPMGLAWRLMRGSLLGWVIGAAAWGAVLGLLAPEMRTLLEANPQMAEYLGGNVSDGTKLLVYMGALLAALLAIGFGVQMIARLAADEMSARTGVILATRVSRWRWLATDLVFTAIGVAAIIVAGGLATDAALAAVGESQDAGSTFAASLAFLPPALLVVGLAGLGWAIGPRLAHLGWALLGWASLVGLLADTLHLPDWARGLSPLWYTGRVPLEPVSVVATVVLTMLTAVVVAAMAIRFRSRDLAAG